MILEENKNIWLKKIKSIFYLFFILAKSPCIYSHHFDPPPHNFIII